MYIDILTIFPEMFTSPFAESIVKRAQDKSLVQINIHNLRDWSTDNYKSVDDRPFGGGPGMIMRVDVVDRAVSDLKEKYFSSFVKRTDAKRSGDLRLTTDNSQLITKVVLLDTKGPFYTQQKAQQLSQAEHLILIAPHFEGIDHRVHKHIADEVISIGPYVLTGGELPTMVVIDSIVRLLPGVINEESLKEESYSKLNYGSNQPTTYNQQLTTTIEAPQYTRPADYKGWKVPEVLLSGNHKEIEKWRKK